MMWVFLLQDASGGGSFDPIELVQYGVLGMVLLAVLFGWLWAKPAVERLILDKERAEARADKLQEILESKAIPALSESATVIRDISPVLIEVKHVLSELKRGG